MTCFNFLRKWKSRGLAVETFRRNARQSGRQPAFVFHRLFALRLGDFEGAGPEIEIGRQGDDREPAFRQRPRACKARRALESGNLPEFARLMDVHWQRKKQRSGGMSNPKINEWYDLAMANGALGGKLIGAGGGGFLMFYGEDKVETAPCHDEGRVAGSALPFRFRGNQTRHFVSALAKFPWRFWPADWPRGCGPSPKKSRNRSCRSPGSHFWRTSLNCFTRAASGARFCASAISAK